MKRRLVTMVAGLFFSPFIYAQTGISAPTSQSADSDKWRFSITPYIWAMGVTGSVSHNGNNIGTVKLSPGDMLSAMNMAAMLEMETHKGNFGFYLDAVYGYVSGTKSVVAANSTLTGRTSIDMTMLTLAPTYTLQNTPKLYLDGLLGARMFWQNAETSISATQTEASLSTASNLQLFTPIVGLKGRWNLNDSKYFVPFYVDVGGGESSSITSQAYVGVGRVFDWGDISLIAKNTYYQYKPNKATVDTNMFGFALSATFRF